MSPPTASPPPPPRPASVRAAYAAALAASDGDGVVGVHISRQLSATWDAARAAADELGAGVRVVDSRAAALGTGFAAIAAARVAAAGAGLDAAYAAAVDVSARGQCFIVVDSLDALRRGGRISTITALLGTALVTKPLLHVEDGKLALKEKIRTSTKAMRPASSTTAVAAAIAPRSGGAGGGRRWRCSTCGAADRAGAGGGAVDGTGFRDLRRAGRHRCSGSTLAVPRRARCGGGRAGARAGLHGVARVIHSTRLIHRANRIPSSAGPPRRWLTLASGPWHARRSATAFANDSTS